MNEAVAHSDACSTSARPCIRCKCRAWRSGSSSLGISIPEGWRGPSVFEQERRHIQEMTDAGMEFDRAPKK